MKVVASTDELRRQDICSTINNISIQLEGQSMSVRDLNYELLNYELVMFRLIPLGLTVMHQYSGPLAIANEYGTTQIQRYNYLRVFVAVQACNITCTHECLYL